MGGHRWRTSPNTLVCFRMVRQWFLQRQWTGLCAGFFFRWVLGGGVYIERYLFRQGIKLASTPSDSLVTRYIFLCALPPPPMRHFNYAPMPAVVRFTQQEFDVQWWEITFLSMPDDSLVIWYFCLFPLGGRSSMYVGESMRQRTKKSVRWHDVFPFPFLMGFRNKLRHVPPLTQHVMQYSVAPSFQKTFQAADLSFTVYGVNSNLFISCNVRTANKWIVHK